ncbi:LuxR family transcriptional regulator [Leptolyngbya sp. 'hensonii']|uniref:S1C family serine protease n=1 Tax=Leptolyngbya sp. 'hensonii' TaxID=1922337 RepID=UPI00094F85F3|nr:S1C family serine protease [Leptolyngbya sp. 'hensonii']OLP19488.1 LuxR family transcriptional regulator [Leptolyngbya sp. 'hensonii']
MTPVPEISSVLAALSDRLADSIDKAGHALVAINARRRIPSSGVIWQPGIVVTADHTVRRDEEIGVTLASGQTVTATVLGRDPSTDLAVLNVMEESPATIDLGDPTQLRVGHLALAVGRSAERGLGASLGMVSALGGPWRTWNGGAIDQLIRLDLNLYPHLTGGAMVSPEGQILGIVTAGPRDIVLVIPKRTIDRVVQQLTQRGRISRGYLGVGMQPVRLPNSLIQTLNLSHPGGVIIVTLEPEGPAEQSGVLIGDILVALADRPITDTSDVQAMLDSDRIGQPLIARMIRGGTLTEVTLIVGERPCREG